MKNLLMALLALSASLYPLPAQEKPPRELLKSSSQWQWTKEQWNTPETPFMQLREAVDKELFKGVKPETALKTYQKWASQSQKSPQDTKAAFAWIYAAYRAQQVVPDFDKKLFSQARMALSFGRYPSNNSEWARLRFLIESQPLARQQLKEVGERILKKYPKDAEIKYQLVRTLSPTSPREKQQALKYAQDLIRLAPKRANYQALLGGIHFKAWLAHKNDVDAQAGIKAYQEFLLLAPENDSFRPQAQRTIKLLQGQ